MIWLIASAFAHPAYTDGEPNFGPAKVLRTAPFEGCVHRPVHGVRWSCPRPLASQPMVYHFMVEHGRWTGVFATGEVNQLGLVILVYTLVSDWGEPNLTLPSGDQLWEEGDRLAVFHHEPSGDGYAVSLAFVDQSEFDR